MIKVDLAAILDLETFLRDAPEITRKAAALSMNDVLGGSALVRFRKAVAEEVNFPPGYVDDRIELGQKATPTRLVASVIGRQRPTSLARFVVSGAVGQKGGVTIRVKNSAKHMGSAFLVRLNQGTGISDNGYNIGLAIRLSSGVKLNKKDQSRMVHLERDVVLLYGPSVDQILKNEAAETQMPLVADDIATEFFRQFARLAS